MGVWWGGLGHGYGRLVAELVVSGKEWKKAHGWQVVMGAGRKLGFLKVLVDTAGAHMWGGVGWG